MIKKNKVQSEIASLKQQLRHNRKEQNTIMTLIRREEKIIKQLTPINNKGVDQEVFHLLEKRKFHMGTLTEQLMELKEEELILRMDSAATTNSPVTLA